MSRIIRCICVLPFGLVVATRALAQQRLLDPRVFSAGVVFENWSFGSPANAGGAMAVASASQFTLPVTAVVPIVPNWAIDAYVAFANGTVSVDRGGPAGRQQLTLSGLNDAKLRLVGKLRGDNVLLTLGASVPSGTTSLDATQTEALSVLAAPALRFRTPVLGGGPSGTGGLVIAGQAGDWALALAGAFEMRGNYSPSEALAVGLTQPTLKAGNAVRLSFGADRVLASARQSTSVIVDYFTSGELRDPESGMTSVRFRLGPAVAVTYQVQETTGNVESMLYLLERIRTNYSVSDSTIKGSWRSEAEFGLVNAIALSPQWALRGSVDGRFHTASAPDRDLSTAGFATAGVLAGGVTLGLQYATRSNSLIVEPFVRAQRGQLDFGGPTRRATGAATGVTLSTRF